RRGRRPQEDSTRASARRCPTPSRRLRAAVHPSAPCSAPPRRLRAAAHQKTTTRRLAPSAWLCRPPSRSRTWTGARRRPPPLRRRRRRRPRRPAVPAGEREEEAGEPVAAESQPHHHPSPLKLVGTVAVCPFAQCPVPLVEVAR
uniref:Uncharacterized protein n=1 Tax=Oryza glaberrima TaxID=4538 RepID=I1R496_ORYGL